MSSCVLPGMDDMGSDLVNAFAMLDLGENEGAVAAHFFRVAFHDLEVRADGRREVGFVDDEQIGLGDARPPLRGILSPPATSMTWMVKSASSRLKQAARLSPPDSIRRMSGWNFWWSSSSASRLAEMSSRMAACGQPPVSTARMRSAGKASCCGLKIRRPLL